MPEWLIEEGIGETRAILLDGEKILGARCRWPGEFHAGQAISAKLTTKNGTRGTAETPDGRELLVDKLPRDVGEGSTLDLVISRAAMTERGRFKLAAARPISASAPVDDVFDAGRRVHRFPPGLWEDAWSAASSGEVAFNGGSLLFAVTPAMTLIDIDGSLDSRALSMAAVDPIAAALRLLDLGGSIGIDFPTLAAKADRKAVDAALGDALDGWPHERTAMNGFGFVQLVARLEGPSLLHRFATSRVGMSARMALRRAEMVEGVGTTLLTLHPALNAKLKPEWMAEVERRTARPLRIETDPGLAIEAAAAQVVGHE
ncbi:ribonuclease E/G [Qipengyuania vesicularis]|uniref:ribonuclease E/G n=1 Tax=Qipengyuania vesicularis TaxID=2867232 RepID=UPI001C867A22|nr:ribonuclease E/G [Qipengyuania vesicularis]MBX7526254.1 ribonuclease E/G [Qipengyuania vesicularis]